MSRILIAAVLLLAIRPAEALSWVKGDQGQSCNTVCADLDGCSEVWPNSEEDFKISLERAGVAKHCQTIRKGEVRYDPSTDLNTCGWMADMPRVDRCNVAPPGGIYRFCPCGKAPAFTADSVAPLPPEPATPAPSVMVPAAAPPSPSPSADAEGDGEGEGEEEGAIAPDDSPSPAMSGLPQGGGGGGGGADGDNGDSGSTFAPPVQPVLAVVTPEPSLTPEPAPTPAPTPAATGAGGLFGGGSSAGSGSALGGAGSGATGGGATGGAVGSFGAGGATGQAGAFSQQPAAITMTPGTTLPPLAKCPEDVQTCDMGIVLTRDPHLNCEFPACPTDRWPVFCAVCPEMDTCSDHCSGEETQSLPCPNQPKCPDDPDHEHDSFSSCQHVDCRWNQWSEWAVDGCTGLCNRSRTFVNSACGGDPCGGRAHDTKFCESPCNPFQDCVFGQWQQWSDCNEHDHRARKRIIDMPEAGGGQACEGSLEEIQTCVTAVVGPADCEMSEWFEWSGCTRSCGGGQKRRVRSILKKAEQGGKSCAAGATYETVPCAQAPCPDVTSKDCSWGLWGMWSSCSEATRQRTRTRSIDSGDRSGRACNGTTEEIGPCEGDTVSEVDCQFSAWSEWIACTKTCEGGQTYRERKIAVGAQSGGKQCKDSLKETMPCHTQSCLTASTDTSEWNCHLSEWSQWTQCSQKCGQGIERRERKVLAQAHSGGLGCMGGTEEVRGCESDTKVCTQQDCLWADWTEWAQCTVSCGGGFQRRLRRIVKPPIADGKLCKSLGSIDEIQPCSTQACSDACANGQLSQWSEWGACSRTCGKGFEWRSRTVLKEAAGCGTPATGMLSDERPCKNQNCENDIDCELGSWSEWSACSLSCWGISMRTRMPISNSTGDGLPCEDRTREMRSCNGPGDYQADLSKRQACKFVTKLDCLFTPWGGWSACSQSCGGGQRKRTRTVQAEATFGGKACFDALQETQGCEVNSCDPNAKECVWEDWSAWSTCAKCEGERHRTRKIAQLPHGDARGCDAGNATEVAMCPRQCGTSSKLYYCVWGDWSQGQCAHTCGSSSKPLTRTLRLTEHYPAEPSMIVGKAHEITETCEGTEVKYEDCAGLPECGPCVKEDCSFSIWSDWSAPTCDGLCSRTRAIVKPNSECGTPCTGHTSETRACQSENCGGQDCKYGVWTEWDTSGCTNQGEGQKTRSRVIGMPPLHGGRECVGDLKQTVGCATNVDQLPVDCQLSPWELWTSCDRTCGTGQRKRERQLTASARSGTPCSGVMRITAPCDNAPCPVVVNGDCKLSDWSSWSGCTGAASDQAYRERMVVQFATGNGRPCTGVLRETGACPKPPQENCVLSDWHDWGACDATCGGGQKYRTREVAKHARNGGLACAMMDLHMTTRCESAPCETANGCQLSDWQTWSTCSQTCGQGKMTRFRNITQPAAKGAPGCNLDLVQASSCQGVECPGEVDCKLSEWSQWGECKKALGCGVGYRARRREVFQAASAGGMPCAMAPLEEVQSDKTCPGQCNENCIDGYWEDWGQWSACSVTCGGGGHMSRSRMAVEASHCGKPVEGLASDFAPCSAQDCSASVDCAWGSWSEWEACSATCNGQKKRKRAVATPAQNGGQACEGTTLETARCNPSSGETVPAGCPSEGVPKDCVLSPWSPWSPCSRDCEGGHQFRNRTVTQGPEFGGENCEETLQEMANCNGPPCKNHVNCEWNVWQAWSACDRKSKQKTRTRDVKTQAMNGLDCDGPAIESGPCLNGCEDTLHYCVWSDWSSWSSCSASCGPAGRITRNRRLVADADGKFAQSQHIEVPAPRQLSEFSTLRTAQAQGTGRLQELAFAFMCGLLSLAAALSLERWVTRRPQALLSAAAEECAAC